VDTAGNLFIADWGNYRVRKVTPGGVISTVVGYRSTGYSGDGGPATAAYFSYPQDVAVDTAGNLYFADPDNHRIRKITPGGVISSIAGAGLLTPAGMAVDTSGNLYFADNMTHYIKKVTPGGVISTVAGNGSSGYSGDGGPATSATFSSPKGVAVDSAGNLYIADHNNYRIRKITPGGVISTIAGNGSPGYSGDFGPATSAKISADGVAVDSAGNLYIVDGSYSHIRKVGLAGIIRTVAGTNPPGYGGDGGPGTLANLNDPTGVAVDSAGNLFIVDYGNGRIRMVTPSGIISTVAGNGTQGFSGDGGPAISAQLNKPSSVAVDSEGNLFIADTYNNRIRKVGDLSISTKLNLSAGGSVTAGTAGIAATQAGYATVAINSGVAPYGTAVISFKQNGVTVTEAGVPASPPTTAARIFIDYRSSVVAIPARSSSGKININTGIAAVNNSHTSATVTYTLRSMDGATISTGHGIFAAGAHFAKFIDQMDDVAPDFVLPTNFQTSTQFASLEISSTQPLSIIALRMTTNQRSEALFTTTPIADLTQPGSNSVIFFPQFVDGGGYTTSIMLLNNSNETETGLFQIYDVDGNQFVVNQVWSTPSSLFSYSIPAGGAFHFQTDGWRASAKVGWVQLIPDAGTSTPVGAEVFGYNPADVLVTESGVPATVSTTHARVYVDTSALHNTGLAIANPTNTSANITLNAFQIDGLTRIGTSNVPVYLSANGQIAHFAGEFIAGLPAGFTGVLDITSPNPFAALTLRSLYNERNDFLLATFPVADMMLAAPSPIVFPQLADGGGYMTQFILIGTGGASSTSVNYYDENGTPLAVGK
jgi:sugar lactone lactonase YvrE